ncbi:MAG: esterase-like activity of phytase family protein [Chamaesiphon sp.]|nr:esterase-like activity of phytase family protein [Chamaesiphon sp.]
MPNSHLRRIRSSISKNGKLLDRFIPKGTATAPVVDLPAGTFGTEVLPEVYAQRRSNRGFEAVAIEGTKLYAFMQSPIEDAVLGTIKLANGSTLKPSDANYAIEAIKSAILQVGKTDNKSNQDLIGGKIYAPVLISQGSLTDFVKFNPTNNGGENTIHAYFNKEQGFKSPTI